MWICAIVVLALSASSDVHCRKSDERSIKDKYVLVTGAAEGIGYAIADNFLREDARLLVLVDKNKELLEQATRTLRKKYGSDKVKSIHGDITKDLNKVDRIVMANWGNPDVLVNNAGVNDPTSVFNTINTNLIANTEWTMRMFNDTRRDRGGNGSTIMNIGGIYSYVKDPFIAYFKGASYGMYGVTTTLGHEYLYRTTGVRCILLAPGFTRTTMTAGQITADDLADVMAVYKRNVEWNTADDVGKGAVIAFKNANSGESYSVTGGRVYKSPDTEYVSAQDIDDMMKY